MTRNKHGYIHGKQKVVKNEHIFQLKQFSHVGKNNGMHHSSDFYKDQVKVAAYKEKQKQIL